MKIFGLLDCNNFYASCERVFEPGFKNKALVVLSNNDGCIIARSQEAKDLGIQMGEPVFKCEHILQQYKVIKRSGNFTLYGDLSDRVMSVLASQIPDLEVYSIDEAFFSLGDSSYMTAAEALLRARQIQTDVERFTGIPVSVGLAPNKVLAKLANNIAKKKRLGVFSLYYDPQNECADALTNASLSEVDVFDIWGIGRNLGRFLHRSGVHTALDFKYSDNRWVRNEMKVNGARIQQELRGLSCLPLQFIDDRTSRSILSSRSFGNKVRDLFQLEQALANFVAIAAHKLRAKKLLAKNISVYLRASNQGYGQPRHPEGAESGSLTLDYATDYTPALIKAAHKILYGIFHKNLDYKKAGIMLTGLTSTSDIQLKLGLDFDMDRQAKINNLVDSLNTHFGVNTIYWSSMGKRYINDKPQENSQASQWRAQQSFRSPNYTTNWDALPLIKGMLPNR